MKVYKAYVQVRTSWLEDWEDILVGQFTSKNKAYNGTLYAPGKPGRDALSAFTS